MKYINIHRHGAANAEHEFGIENIYNNFLPDRNNPYSAGLHPWYVDVDWHNQFNELKETVTHKNCMAIGECGLDRICKTDFNLQKNVFAEQVRLANAINKPLIIHCVRAHEDVLFILRQLNNTVPVIFHGFNKSFALAEKIIAQGYFLSFGKDLQRIQLQEIFAGIPIEHIFLETDDKEISIEVVYSIAASARNISTEDLSLQLQQNLQKVLNTRI